jgi:hypothetical protein
MPYGPIDLAAKPAVPRHSASEAAAPSSTCPIDFHRFRLLVDFAVVRTHSPITQAR